ncbi:hypothetical protein [Mesobacillus subterraneus]|uniref:Lipoprotein n=1 Tax=Mesobacillus subterraneus TaxID=285983 RepID=A0A3R9EEP7_9BACI|nr:hypothetical protein [Mesobacillus subterraneus]RSD28707.1 hypothetical protein EJA10_03795 [Mesobacillus subterraneus]
MMQLRKYVILSVAIIFSWAVVTGCSKTEAKEINGKVVEEVLKLQFSGPDEKLMDLIENPKYRTVKDGVEENQEFDQYMDELYGAYFTGRGLEFFVPVFANSYQVYAYNFDYKLTYKGAAVEKHGSIANRYDFVAEVGYQKEDGKEETVEVEGYVLFSEKEEGKIEKFHYGNDNGLSDRLRN